MAQSQTVVVRLEDGDARENLIALLAAASSSGATFATGADGLLTLDAGNREIVLADSAALVAASGLSAPALVRALNDDEALLLTLADAAGLVPLASIGPEFQADFIDATGALLDEGVVAAVDSGTGLSGLDPLGGLGGSDGARVGSAANDGTLLSHLAPVASLASYFSVNLELKTFANLFGRVNAGVGPDLRHLPPLPDEDYARGIDPTVFAVGTSDAPVSQPAPPVLDIDTYVGTEDMPITGNLAENDTLPNPGAIFSIGTPPPDNGTLTIMPDGTFEFVPDPNFSGTVEFTYTVTDPASGTVTDQTAIFEIAPVADPVATAPATTPVFEDVATPFGTNITYGLVDTDGSEVVVSITIIGVPDGAVVEWTLAPGATVVPVPGGYEIGGDEAAIRATLDTFAVTPPADTDADFTLDVAIVTREPDGSTATATTTHTIDVTGVVDAPAVTGGSYTTPEDRPVPLVGIAAELTDRDGSETIAVTVSGVPADASLTVGTDLGGGVWSLDPAELADIAFIPPADFDGTIDLTLSATTTETATGETATIDAPVSIQVEAVADAPTVTGDSFTTVEDTAISLATLGGALTDTDGSETLTFRIEGLPAGTTTSAGTIQPDGSLLLTPAELATLSVTPPLNFHGAIPLTLVAIATEGANGDTAETATPFEIVVTAVADTPALTVQPAAIDEDATLALGPLVTMAPTDTDGSESVSLVTITGVPAGSVPAWTLVGTAAVTAVAGGYEITGDAADIRATLDTFALAPPTHVGDDFTLQVAVTVTDADGSTATTSAPLPVDVVPVADAPLVTGGDFTTDEDVVVALTGLDAALVDLDGSETISIALTGVPAGTDFGGAGSDQGGGVWAFTPAELAAGLTFTPPLHSDADAAMVLSVTVRETEGDSTTVTAPVNVTVAAVADAPTASVGPAAYATEEDTPVALALSGGLVDGDGSETLTYRIEGVPAGASLSNGVDQGGGVWALTDADLTGLVFTPPADLHGTFPLTLVAVATEATGDVAETALPFEVTVDAQADMPTLTPGASAVDEDMAVTFGPAIAFAPTDTDGSEAVSRVEITDVPAGASVTFTAGAANVVAIPGGYAITGDEAAIRAALDTFAITPPLHSGVDFALAVAVTVTDADGSTATATGSHPIDVTPVADAPGVTGGTFTTDEDVSVALAGVTSSLVDNDESETLTLQLTGVPEGASIAGATDLGGGIWSVAPADVGSLVFTPPANFHGTANLTLVATAEELEGGTAVSTAAITITVEAEADAPSLTVLPAATNEDVEVNIGTLITTAPTDTDDSEAVTSVVIANVPPESSVVFTGAVTVSPDATSYTITGTPAEIRATLDTFAITPPEHVADDFTLQVTSTVTDADGSTASTTEPLAVTVTPVTDAPDVTGGDFTTDEDTTVSLGAVGGALVDRDNSESVTYRITGVDPDAAFTSGTRSADGTFWTFTQAEIDAGLSFTPPAHEDGLFEMVMEVTASENGTDEVSTADVNVTVTPIADPALLTTGTTTGTEDNDVPFGADISLAGVDLDGSETMEVVLTGIRPGATVFFDTELAGSVVQTGATITVTGSPQEVAALLATVGVTPAEHDASDFTVGVSVTTTDGTSTETVTDTHAVQMIEVADAPTAPTGSTALDEDVRTVFGTGIDYTLVDADGSEAVSEVTLTGFPATSTVDYAVANGATVTAITGGYEITGDAAAIRTTLDTFAYTSVEHDDEDVQLAVTVTTRDANGDTATTPSTHDLFVAAVADAPTGSGAGAGAEDTAIATPITVALADEDDGSEAITQAVLEAPTGVVLGFPADANVVRSGQTWTVTGTQSEIEAALAGTTATPPANSDVDFDLSVTVTAAETNPSEAGDVTLASADETFDVRVTVDAVADAPTVGATDHSGAEDEPIALTSLTGALVDATDGSEALTFRIEGLPADAVLSVAGSPVAATGLTLAQIENLAVTAPQDFSGDMNLRLVAIATESANNDTDETGVDFTVTVEARADAPDLTPGSSTTNEDTAVNVGSQITYAETDVDESETITQVVVADVPDGAIVTYGGATNVAIVTEADGTRTFTITGTETAIRTTLDAFTVQPPQHVGNDIPLEVTVTSTEPNGEAATTTETHVIDVVPVADAPTVTGANVTTPEDTGVALTTLAADLVDESDGSETLSIRITGVDPAATFSSGTRSADGTTWTFTQAEIAADPTYTPPPQADGTFTMQIEATATEAEGDTATTTADVVVNVTAVLDDPVLVSGTSTALEDATIPLGSDIDLTIDDLDGSQTMEVVLGGVPTTATTAWNTGLPGTVTPDGAGGFTFAGTTAEVQALLDTFTVTPDDHDDANFQVAIDVSTTEDGTNFSRVSGTQDVTVSAVADRPNLAGPATQIQTDEDVAVAVPVTLSLVDADGSETYDYVEITGVPADATLDVTTSGTAVWNATTGRLTGPVADIEATLANGLIFTGAEHDGTDVTLTVTAQTIESAPGEAGDVAVTTASRSVDIVIDVVPVADGVSSEGGTFNGFEDTPVALTRLSGTGVDDDGSETVTFQMTGVPAGATFDAGTDEGSGVWSFTAAEIAAGISFTAPEHAHGTYDMVLVATTTEGENGSSQTSTSPVQVVVEPVADEPRIFRDAIGNEDESIAFGAEFRVLVRDTDGSERLTEIVLEMPAGAVPTYTAAGGATVTVSGDVYTITAPAGATDDTAIQATLDSFAWTPPTHSDADIVVRVSATSMDANGDTATRTANRNVVVRAVADTPSGTADDIRGDEDTAIALTLTAVDSADTDGSETLSVRLTNLPAGSVVAGSVAGASFTADGDDWIVTAPDTATLNDALASATYTPPEDFSGVVNATMQVISTEGATGEQVAVAEATFDVPFTITVDQVADAPELRAIDATEGAAGYEDQPIRLVVDIRPADDDGSEVITSISIGGIPTDATIVDADGNPLGVLEIDGTVTLTEAQLADLHVLAPPDSNEDFQLTVSATTSETNQGLAGDGASATDSVTIDVAVIGVADPADITASPITVAEDQTIPFGTAVTASLADTDGSESLYFVIAGLPVGTVPSVGTYIGGSWQVDAADMPGLTIPAPANFSGAYTDYAPSLTVTAITQENDGDQTSVVVPVDITITPVVDAQSWNPATSNPEDGDISLAGAAPAGLVDGDGSETIVSYTFDLNGIVADAGIGATVASTQAFIDNHISGTFTDNNDGTITVLPGNLAGVAFATAAFPDSNRDFGVPVETVFQDTNGTTTETLTVNDTFQVDLVGVADVPTVFADDYSGDDATRIALNPPGTEFGGTTTDTDVALGQPQSETIYYIVSGLDEPGEPRLSFVDGSGNPVGFGNPDGTWLFSPADLANLHVIAPGGESGTATLTLTTVATENDGDVETNATAFTVTIANENGEGDVVQPLPPIVTVNPMVTDEDGARVLDIDVSLDPADPSPGTPSISVVIGNVPPGSVVEGAFPNVTNGTWVTNAANINAGGVTITPPADYSGPLDFTVNATTTNSDQQSASTGAVPVSIDVTPVADGPTVAIIAPGGNEDDALALDITLGLSDTDGSETIVDTVRITLSAGTLSAGSETAPGSGVWELTQAQLAGLTVTPPLNDDTDITVTVEATSRETANGDTQVTTETATITVTARADQAVLGVANSSGDEDTAIVLTGLSAGLADNDTSEILSVNIAGVPEGSILSAGANNGDGSWTVDPGDLATLEITPPLNWSGTMALELVGYTLERNGDASEIRLPFTVTVNPVADGVVFTPLPQSGDTGTPIALDLDLAPGDTTGTGTGTGEGTGENPPEVLTIVLTGPDVFTASFDGQATSATSSLTRTGPGEWTFVGTAAEGNTLAITSFGATDAFDLGVSVVTSDNGAVGTPSTATMPITLTAPGLDVAGNGTAETLTGGAGSDLIAGGGGSDTLTGGAGADLFLYDPADLAGAATDTITDFTVGEDVLDLSQLIDGYDPTTDVLADFVALSEAGGATTVSVDRAGGGIHGEAVVELGGATGLDLDALVAAGTVVV